MTYRFVPHTADARVRFDAGSEVELFLDGVNLVRQMVSGFVPVEPGERRPISLKAARVDELFYGFLKELLYAFATERFIPATATFAELTPTLVRAEIEGERFDPARHEAQPEVKAVTRHALEVTVQGHRWMAEVVLDV